MYKTNSFLISSHSKFSLIEYFFVLLYLTGLYTGIYWYINDNLFIPHVFCGITAPYFLIKNRSSIKVAHLKVIFFLVLITFLGVIFGPNYSIWMTERLKGLFQLIYAITVGYSFFITIRKWEIKNIRRLFFWIVICLLIGSTVEILYIPFRDFVDSFRLAVYRRSLYLSWYRDIVLYGWLRPNFFSREPSHVGIFFTLSLFTWLAFSKNKYRYFVYSILAVLGLIIIRSLILCLTLPLAVIIEIFINHGFKPNQIFKKPHGIISKRLLVLVIGMIIIIFVAIQTIFFVRTQRIISKTDMSFVRRIAGPAITAYSVISQYPLFGSGISGKEAVEEITNKVYWSLGAEAKDTNNANNNYLFLFVIYYGLLGGICFVLAFYFFLNVLGVKHKFFSLIAILLFSQTNGGFVTMWAWGQIFIILLIASLPLYEKPKVKISIFKSMALH